MLPLAHPSPQCHVIHDHWTHPIQHSKRHLSRFSGFSGLTSVTDRLTDNAAQSVTVGCIYVYITRMWPNITVSIIVKKLHSLK